MGIVEIPLEIKSEHLTIKLSTIVDKEVYDRLELKYFDWRVRYDNETFSVYTKVLDKKIFLHRMITKCPKDKVVDHIDGDGLNNLLRNLRICSAEQNNMNSGKPKNKKCTSKYIGVVFDIRYKKPWKAVASVKGSTKLIGQFDSDRKSVV